MSIRGAYKMVLTLALTLVVMGFFTACKKDNPTSTEANHVVILVSGGHNSIADYLAADLQDVADGYLPTATVGGNNVLVVLARTKDRQNKPSVPVLYRMYRNDAGNAVRDTLLRFSKEDRLFGGTVLQDALVAVKKHFPARSYGMVLSSHASGWLPEGYYESPSKFEKGRRSIGQDLDNGVSVEMDLKDFADAIPYRLEYAVLDCCLTGGIEVAWELIGRANLVAFTQTETLADGFNYKNMMNHLLAGPTPDPRGVCLDFFNLYKDRTGLNQSATISLVDTRQLNMLASVCSVLFEKYRSEILALDGNDVQGYFRSDRHYFYDLKDILVKAGITASETALLDTALDYCLLFKAATPWFMNTFPITNYCGLSMYLPSMGTEYLNNYYKTRISWNDATELVR